MVSFVLLTITKSPFIFLVDDVFKNNTWLTSRINLSYDDKIIYISAKENKGVDELKDALMLMVNKGKLSNNDTIVSNSRHYEALVNAFESIKQVSWGMKEELSTDLLAIDLRQSLHYLGEITGEVSTDDLLGNIFANFCIGK